MSFKVIGDKSALSWEEFSDLVQDDVSSAEENQFSSSGLPRQSEWIFRGQSSSSWGLETSLERFLSNELGEAQKSSRARRYYYALSSTVPWINSLTERNFQKFDPHSLDLTRGGAALPCYELLCYARHHGFPTPTLDWSLSYLIAAFFAFRSPEKGEDVSIFAFQEYSGGARGGWVGDPFIDVLGPYVETHPRHFSQQSVYTTCTAKEDGSVDGGLLFMNHLSAVEANPENHNLKKYIIRSDQRKKVLKLLMSMNINDYTLFGDEEALMRTLAFKSIGYFAR